jgi:S-adenosylmethionine:tRNA ribosyltransferase-isomerase
MNDGTVMTEAATFTLPAALEAEAPPEARGLPRDGVRMLVSRAASGTVEHHAFTDLPRLLLPGDLLVVNTSRTLPAAVPAGRDLVIHFSTALADGTWLVEPRIPDGASSRPNAAVAAGQLIALPGGAELVLRRRATQRLWQARLSTAVVPYLLRHGEPIRYSYAAQRWPLDDYQTVFGRTPGSAEMPSAARPFTPAVVTELVTRGVTIAPITLHCGVSSLEAGEDPYPEQYDVPPATVRQVELARRSGGRVIAIGTTVVRALETAARSGAAGIEPSAGWTSLVVTEDSGLRAVDGLLTGLHEPRSSHLRMLAAFHGPELLGRCYDAALSGRYRWHEFGDVHLLFSRPMAKSAILSGAQTAQPRGDDPRTPRGLGARDSDHQKIQMSGHGFLGRVG